MDTRTAVWVSTPEKFSKIVLGKTRNFSRKFRGVSAPALDKNPAVNQSLACVAASVDETRMIAPVSSCTSSQKAYKLAKASELHKREREREGESETETATETRRDKERQGERWR